MRLRSGSDDALCCSFCKKSQNRVGKLVSSPSEYPRAYICDECIAVCNSIIEDDRYEEAPKPAHNFQSFIAHPQAPELVSALQAWVELETRGERSKAELDDVRRLAMLIL